MSETVLWVESNELCAIVYSPLGEEWWAGVGVGFLLWEGGPSNLR